MNTLFKKQTKLIITLSFLFSLGLILFVAFNANRYINVMQSNNNDLFDAFKISEILKSFKNNIGYLENKQRSFLITGDNKFLDEYRLKESETKSYLKQLEKYFESKEEKILFQKLNTLTYQKINQGKDLFANHFINTKAENTSGAGLVNMSDILETIEQINESQARTTQSLINNSIEYVSDSKKYAFLEILIGFLVALTAVVLLFRDINVRNQLEKDLFVAKKRADNTALMKEQFMANMSHEIRTPMNAIIGFSDLLQKDKLSSLQLEYVSAIKTSGENLLNIVNDILDFSKIETGHLKIENIFFEPQLMLNNLRLMFEKKADDKLILFYVSCDPNIPKTLIGDPNRLMQILINLTNNALKFTEKGSVNVECKLKQQDENSVTLLFVVQDSGVGISPKKQSQIFERFNQGDAEITRKYGGTGLGLAIVKSLVEIQQGIIELKSELNKGSTFSVELTYGIQLENHNSNQIETKNEFAFENEVAYKVLLAEDNLLNQKLAATVLRNFNLDVTVTDNGADAIVELRNKKYDLVLLDIQMPIMDGYTAAKIIRNDLLLKTPIIAMTANVLQSDIQKCKDAGMDDFITKPFREKELFELLNKYLLHSNNKKKEKLVTLSENDVIDLQDLYELANGDKTFVSEMMEIFLEQNPKEIKELEKALSENRCDAVYQLAHKMKSAIGFMGVKGVLFVLNELEVMGENNELTRDAGVKVNFLKIQCELACLAINTELQKIKSELNA
jgi:signal transduction histidine kinase/CheY-like chemotaxis protein